ncbi:hypothetical protein NDU88_007606 [Pleurodeles waltl]|uniref:Uncharacterized protein n=1 Tax=Pleurodeles waltl TaxID=8319 RepID=A0AAV7RVJ6_PLEWA|nr:hypothetical protein NDU88_007606 [Pleurodeles waltl]
MHYQTQIHCWKGLLSGVMILGPVHAGMLRCPLLPEFPAVLPYTVVPCLLSVAWFYVAFWPSSQKPSSRTPVVPLRFSLPAPPHCRRQLLTLVAGCLQYRRWEGDLSITVALSSLRGAPRAGRLRTPHPGPGSVTGVPHFFPF